MIILFCCVDTFFVKKVLQLLKIVFVENWMLMVLYLKNCLRKVREKFYNQKNTEKTAKFCLLEQGKI